MKVLALDLGDSWTGTAMSDPLKIIATPYQTIKTEDLLPFLHNLMKNEKIETILVGYPKTMKGKESDQTKKVQMQKEIIDKEFPLQKCILWDERLSSKQARSIQKKNSKTDAHKEHSIAAALILETYLQFLT